MRIVAGSLRGRRLAEPLSYAIRPTSDRVRESLFNIIDHRFPGLLEGARVLDVFSGTGALGIEALSRGAREAAFVENGIEGNRLLKRNLADLALDDRARIMRRDATRPGPPDEQGAFDLAFADPPYGRKLGEKALEVLIAKGWLRHGALIVLEERRGCLPARIAGGEPLEVRRFGDTEFGFYRVSGLGGEDDKYL